MAKLTKQDVLSPFIGNTLNERYASLTWHEFEGDFILYNYDWMDNPDLRKCFGLTDKLHEDWLYRGIDYAIHLSVDDGKIHCCFVEKIRMGHCGHFKPNVHILTPTTQELRIARRILEYITKI